jgi:hypothetical protein
VHPTIPMSLRLQRPVPPSVRVSTYSSAFKHQLDATNSARKVGSMQTVVFIGDKLKDLRLKWTMSQGFREGPHYRVTA